MTSFKGEDPPNPHAIPMPIHHHHHLYQYLSQACQSSPVTTLLGRGLKVGRIPNKTLRGSTRRDHRDSH